MDTLSYNLCRAMVLEMTVIDVGALELQSQREIENGSFKLLDILHHFSSGMKALGTEIVYTGMDELR